jgi:hypothetical protein
MKTISETAKTDAKVEQGLGLVYLTDATGFSNCIQKLYVA